MKLEDCRVGMRVVYRTVHAMPEEGTITSVNDHFAFVCYGLPGSTSKATPPDLLMPLAPVRRLKLLPVRPTHHMPATIILDGRLQTVGFPVYPPSRGAELRQERQDARLGLRATANQIARFLDEPFTATQLSGVENGALVPEREEDWDEILFAAISNDMGDG